MFAHQPLLYWANLFINLPGRPYLPNWIDEMHLDVPIALKKTRKSLGSIVNLEKFS